MKKVIKMICTLYIITFVFTGCSASDKAKAEKVAKEFAEEIYTVDSKKIDNYASLIKIVNIESHVETMQLNDKNLKALMTKDGYRTLVGSRLNTMNAKGCSIGEYTMEVTEVTLSKNAYDDNEENKAGYNFDVKIKLISNKDKTEKTDTANGYIGLEKEGGKWKVFVYKVNTLPKEIAEALKIK